MRAGQSATSLPGTKTHAGGTSYFAGGLASLNPVGQEPATELDISRKREISKGNGMDLVNPGMKKKKKATGAKFI